MLARNAYELGSLEDIAHRTNGVVIHMPTFYSAFSVTPADKMFNPPESRVTLW